MSSLLRIILATFVIATVDKMGEIDDNYKEDVESTDQKFLDELKGGKKNALENYHKELKKDEETLIGRYKRKNARDIRKARKFKPKGIKKEKFKHLKIKHFDFEFTLWERIKMWWDLFAFKFVRRFKIVVSFIPSWMIYTYYKISKTGSFTYRDASRYRERKWDGFRDYVVKKSVGFWKWVKEVYTKLMKGFVAVKNVVMSKIFFWRKKKEGEEGEKKEGEGEKSEEEKTEGGDEKPEGEEEKKEESGGEESAAS